jgi:hypothetical protein
MAPLMRSWRVVSVAGPDQPCTQPFGLGLHLASTGALRSPADDGMNGPVNHRVRERSGDLHGRSVGPACRSDESGT